MTDNNDSQDQTSDKQEDKTEEKSKDVKMVPESDLIAIKKSLSDKLKDAEKGHKEEIESLTGKLDEATNSLSKAEAKVKTLEETQSQSDNSEELSKAKEELKTATERGEELAKQALEYRRKLLAHTYGISEDAIAEKSFDQLGFLEEALELTKSSKGSTGNYAAGAGSGGSAAPESNEERAKRILAEADKRSGAGNRDS
jgi:multidrug resistance efflux pump